MGSGELVFRRKPVVHTYDDEAELPTQQPTKRLFVGNVTDTEAAAVVHDIQWPIWFLRVVRSDVDFSPVPCLDQAIDFFCYAGRRLSARGDVLSRFIDESFEGRDIGKFADVEDLTVRCFEELCGSALASVGEEEREELVRYL